MRARPVHLFLSPPKLWPERYDRSKVKTIRLSIPLLLFVLSFAVAGPSTAYADTCLPDQCQPPRLVDGSPRAITDDDLGEGFDRVVRWRFDFTNCEPGQLTVRVWRDYSKRKDKYIDMKTWPDQACQWQYASHGGLGGFALTSDGNSVEFRALTRRKRAITFAYQVYIGDKLMADGAFNVYQDHYRATRDKRIWQGTDAFVNYCINGNHTIKSLHGRLYCIKPGESGFWNISIGVYRGRHRSL